MLNKQGIFNRTNPSNQAPIQPSAQTSSLQTKVVSAPLIPVTHPPANESVPGEVKGDALAKSDNSPGSRLIVGPDVKLKGAEIQDCDTLVVEGRVEATMDSRVIQIAVDGSFSGKVGIDVAEIHGRFDGELTARNQLIIHSSGRVSGKIRYGKILIEEGGELSGDIAALGSDSVNPVSVAAKPAFAGDSKTS